MILKNFYGRLWHQHKLNLREERAPKKTVPKKVPKNAFFDLFFFLILPAAQKFWPKQGFFTALGELVKSI